MFCAIQTKNENHHDITRQQKTSTSDISKSQHAIKMEFPLLKIQLV